jgi:hypothetical protein
MNVLKQYYGPTEGPLGLPMQDRQALALDGILKALPKGDEFQYRKAVVGQGACEVLPGERSDVSWISTESPDRSGEVVLAKGFNDAHFKLNPIVTLNHAYWAPPVGKSLWRKAVKDGDRHGIKAKTQYPARPDDWTDGKEWPPDVAFSLVKSDLLRGKSIGFLPLKVHSPSDGERQLPGWKDVGLVIDEWLLLEYACCFLPVQQQAVVEAVSKSAIPVISPAILQALGLDSALFQRPAPSIAFTPLDEVEKAIRRQILEIDFDDLATRAVQQTLDRVRGRV